MKKSFCMIIIYFFITNSPGNSAQSLHLGELFKEVIYSSRRLIPPAYSQAHVKLLSDRRLNHLGYDGYKLTFGDSAYSKFDNELFERMKLKAGKPLLPLRFGEDPYPSNSNSSLKHSFANEHKIPIDGKTETRKILVALYPHNVVLDFASKNMPFPLRWFSPAVEAILNPILSCNRRRLATLNVWHAYTGVAVVGIDKELDWVCHYGLVAPKVATPSDQSFRSLPSHIFPRLTEPNDSDVLVRSAENLKKNPDQLFEYLVGGGTQYYIPYVQKPKLQNSNEPRSFVEDLGIMVSSSGQALPDYQIKDDLSNSWGTGLNMKPCHLTDPEHALAEINIHYRLFQKDYLKYDEFRKINDTLLELHDACSPKEHHSDEEYKRIQEILERNNRIPPV